MFGTLGADQSVRGTTEGDFDQGLKIGTDVEQALSALPNAIAVPGSAGAPSFVYGDLGGTSARTELGIRASLAAIAPAFRLSADNLQLRHLRTDELGFTHARYFQMKNGLKVVGGDLALHVGPSGRVYAANGSARDGVTLSPTPLVAAVDAVETARASRDLPGAMLGSPTLVYLISNTDSMMHLAYEVEVKGREATGMAVRDLVYVDARWQCDRGSPHDPHRPQP